MQTYKIYPIEHIIIEEVKLLPAIRVLDSFFFTLRPQLLNHAPGFQLTTLPQSFSFI